MAKDNFRRYFANHRLFNNKKVKSIEIVLSVEDVEGTVNISDIQVQDGEMSTGEVPATQDMLDKVYFNIDETHNAVNDYQNVYLGEEPISYKDLDIRFFNLMGRGFETVAIPNVYHEDYREEILTTGLDLTLYAKDDYDFLRVSTFYGGELGRFDKTYQDEDLEDNPLNFRYTKEFCVDGGKVGDEIKILASRQRSYKNGKLLPLGVQNFNVGQEENWNGIEKVFYRNKQRFMALPVGAARINIQFMRLEKEGNKWYMIDDGIGFSGLAEFTQWSWGRSKF